MIRSIEIENLRGIQHSSRLEELAPLTVLTGPNGSGKSTVLDALLIATKPEADQAVGRAVERHSTVLGGSRWLFGDRYKPATLTVETEARSWSRRLEWRAHASENLKEELQERSKLQARPPFSSIFLEENKYAEDAIWAQVLFDMENAYAGMRGGGQGLSTVAFVHLVQPGHPVPLHRTFSEVVRAQRRESVYDLLGSLIQGFEQLEILAEDDDEPVLHLNAGGISVPVGLAGDGVQSFIQMALEIAVVPDGLVLLEEPEVYQHPKAIWRTAQVLLANCRRGVQLVLSTHSLELIDALVAEATAEDLEAIALFNLKLEDGRLQSSRHGGEEIVFARRTLENDLR